jgi:hypothetical protein
VTDEQDFQGKVLGALGRIEANLKHNCDDVKELQDTVYGEHRRGGLVRDVEAGKSLWRKSMALVTILIGGVVAWLKWGAK